MDFMASIVTLLFSSGINTPHVTNIFGLTPLVYLPGRISNKARSMNLGEWMCSVEIVI